MRHGNWFQDLRRNVIATKWVFINKLNEDGHVTRNKERILCKGYAQVKGVDFEENFAPIAWNGGNNNDLGLCMFQKNQSISDGCKINIFKWRIRRRSLHRTTRRDSTVRKRRL
jgi:hypothetical protein